MVYLNSVFKQMALLSNEVMLFKENMHTCIIIYFHFSVKIIAPRKVQKAYLETYTTMDQKGVPKENLMKAFLSQEQISE